MNFTINLLLPLITLFAMNLSIYRVLKNLRNPASTTAPGANASGKQHQLGLVFLKNGPYSAFFRLFLAFQTNITILTTNICEKCYVSSSIHCRDLNPHPLEHKSPPITTRPGIPPKVYLIFTLIFNAKKLTLSQGFESNSYSF